MSYDHITHSTGRLHAMINYLRDEAMRAKTPDDVTDLLKVIQAMLEENATFNTVQGLSHIRAEVMPCGPNGDVNVTTKVPESLVSTFYDLSDKMNQLQDEDPETFANASNALHWLANNDKCVN